ncbi:MAG: COX15/CtaA family protein [Acidobacteriota bacterium]
MTQRDALDGSEVLAVGFGTTAAMWAAGYVGRLPVVQAPNWALGVLLPVLLVAGGWVAGRYGSSGWRGGAAAGVLASVLNLLVLGSLLAGPEVNSVRPSAIAWLLGSLACGALLGAAGAVLGARVGGARPPVHWTGWFATEGAIATLLLLLAGGLVTSNQAGLAVVDWPNSFGYNMFLYPLSRMTGGIYYEHAHRLFGSLVGLTTVVIALHLQRVETRRWVKRFALALIPVVVTQGLLGGLRVTGRFTTSTSPEDVAPNVGLAVVHGVMGQVFFGMMVALAVVVSRRWTIHAAGPRRRSVVSDRQISTVLVCVLLVQLVLGAVQRHLDRGLLIHISLAVVVVLVALAAGVRAVHLYADTEAVGSAGRALLWLVCAQVTLGAVTLFAVTDKAPGVAPLPWQALVATAHQGTGALLLAVSVVLMVWLHRLAGESENRAS